MRRRRINQIFDPVLTVDIAATKVRRLVYLLVANKPIRYPVGYSRIVYIGTTGHGVRRIAASASHQIVGASKANYEGFGVLMPLLCGRNQKRAAQRKTV